MTDHQQLTLPNGLHIIHKQIQGSEISHCGFIVNAGTRDELPGEEGMAHFLEHMMFKGTPKRRSFHILSRLDVVGGDLNAYTTKERTCLHASFRNQWFGRAFELLCDILMHAHFPEKELEKEKQVVIDEINQYQDYHDESLLDDFEAALFGDQNLAHPILGTAASVSSFNREKVIRFRERQYGASNVAFSYVGPLSWPQLLRKVQRILEQYPLTGSPPLRTAAYVYRPFVHQAEKNATQAYVALGNQAYPANDLKRAGMLLLNNLLGGDGMNSRLNLSVRERNGLVYSIESNYTPYSDTGLWYVYFSCDPGYQQRVLRLVKAELTKLRDKKLGHMQLHLAKQQFISRIVMAEESRTNLMLALGNSLFDYGRIDTLPEIVQRIEAVTAEELQDIAREIFDPTQLSTLLYLPKN